MLTVLGQLALLLVISFLLGSIPWGVIISRVFYHTDLREHGSGNIGTTNAIRTMGKVGGYAVFVLDFGKGIVAGLIAAAFGTQVLPANVLAVVEFVQMFGGSPNPFLYIEQVCLAVAFLGCTMGHIFCPWFQGRQGHRCCRWLPVFRVWPCWSLA